MMREMLFEAALAHDPQPQVVVAQGLGHEEVAGQEQRGDSEMQHRAFEIGAGDVRRFTEARAEGLRLESRPLRKSSPVTIRSPRRALKLSKPSPPTKSRSTSSKIAANRWNGAQNISMVP